MGCRVGVVRWTPREEIPLAIECGLRALGHRAVVFEAGDPIPQGIDVLFSFGPFGPFLPLLQQLSDLPNGERPLFVHWNTEQIPDLRIPWAIVTWVGGLRSWAERLYDRTPLLQRVPGLGRMRSKMTRFRYVGDYHYAYRRGCLDLLVESSEIYARLHRRTGLAVLFVPWGTAAAWHAELGFERDVDVLWMGRRRTPRRRRWIERIRRELAERGIGMCVVDNEEHPFVYGEERTQLLNRAKITLNLLPNRHDDAFSYRFHMAAGNRSLVVSEPTPAHCSIYRAGTHYVSAPVASLVDTMAYYLAHEGERQRIVEAAYELVTTQLTFDRSVEAIMGTVGRAINRTQIKTDERRFLSMV